MSGPGQYYECNAHNRTDDPIERTARYGGMEPAKCTAKYRVHNPVKRSAEHCALDRVRYTAERWVPDPVKHSAEHSAHDPVKDVQSPLPTPQTLTGTTDATGRGSISTSIMAKPGPSTQCGTIDWTSDTKYEDDATLEGGGGVSLEIHLPI
jgi:hypothetical protein